VAPRIAPGIYQHYKCGDQYTVLGTVVWHDGNGENKPKYFVCYHANYANNPLTRRAEQCIRPVEEWVESVPVPGTPEVMQPRYKLICELGP
jgi:hypothetical protein